MAVIMESKTALKIYNILKTEYPELPESFLEFKNSYELLIAVILSAQCTDKMVNIVTPKLFAAYPDAQSLAAGNLDDIMAIIKPTGFFQNKAKSIKNCGAALIEKFDSKVPQTVGELITLPGVGRKTANVVTQIAFNKTEGVVIDTHVKRLSNRIGFSLHDHVDKIEDDLMKLFDVKIWKPLTFYLILHGRNICIARKPDCDHCVLSALCSYYSDNKGAPAANDKAAKKTAVKSAAKPAVKKTRAAAKKAGK
jgi:endonuclease-3